MQKIKDSFGAKVEITRETPEGSRELCMHTGVYTLMSIFDQPVLITVGKEKRTLTWVATEIHKAGTECLFSDIALLQKLATAMERDSMIIYRAMESDRDVAREMAGGSKDNE